MRGFIIAVLVAITLALRLDGVPIRNNKGATGMIDLLANGAFIILGAVIAAVFGYIGAVRAAKTQVRALEDQREEERRRSQQMRHQKKYEMALALHLEAKRLGGAAGKRISVAQAVQSMVRKHPLREQMTISVFPLIWGERGDIGLLSDDLQDKVVDLVSEVDDYNSQIETLPRTTGGPVVLDQPTEEKLIQLQAKAGSVAKDLNEFITRVRQWRCKRCGAFIDEILDVSEDGQRKQCPICNNMTRIAQVQAQNEIASQVSVAADVVKSGSTST